MSVVLVTQREANEKQKAWEHRAKARVWQGYKAHALTCEAVIIEVEHLEIDEQSQGRRNVSCDNSAHEARTQRTAITS